MPKQLTFVSLLILALGCPEPGPRVDLTCIQTGFGLYGHVLDDGTVIESWFGPCSDSLATPRYLVEHVADEAVDHVRTELSLFEPGLSASATTQVRFDTTIGRTYELVLDEYEIVGSVAPHEQGIQLRVMCPSFPDPNSEDFVWWFSTVSGWYVGLPRFEAPATETCQLKVFETCTHTGTVGEIGQCRVVATVRER